MNHRTQNGFILPTVLLIGLGTMIIGLSLLQTSSSIRNGLDTIDYNRIANEAAEAGANYASYCLKSNNYVQTWGPAAGRPVLTQSTNCYGSALSKPITSLTTVTGTKSTFAVGDLTRGKDGSYIVNASSIVNRQTPGGTTIQSFNHTALQAVPPSSLSYGNVTYGYYPVFSSSTTSGAFFAVLGSDGKFHTAGSNDFGQLGNGTTANSTVPGIYDTPGNVAQVSAYSNFVSKGYNLFVKMADGTIYGSGLGNVGQLGTGSTATQNPTPKRFRLPGSEKGTFVAPNGTSTYVLTDQNNIYAAGACLHGALGNGGGSSCSNVSTPTRVLLPTPSLSDPNTLPTSNITTDSYSTYVLMQGGRVYGWGYNSYGELANGTTSDVYTPIQIGQFGDNGHPKATQIAFNGDTIYIIADDGNVYAAGNNGSGEVGLPPFLIRRVTSVYRIPIPASAGKIVQIATDQWTALFKTDKGQVWGVGSNVYGELGVGYTSTYTLLPVQFILPNGVKANYIYNTGLGANAIPTNNTLVIGDDGKIYAAGNNTYGQLGLGYTSTSVSTPQVMQVFDGTTVRASDVKSGLGTTVILSSKNTYYTVGNNAYGQLADGTTISSSTPATAQYLKTIPAFLF